MIFFLSTSIITGFVFAGIFLKKKQKNNFSRYFSQTGYKNDKKLAVDKKMVLIVFAL